jgi:hypothetical protein
MVDTQQVGVSLASALFFVSLLGITGHLEATFTFGSSSYVLSEYMALTGAGALVVGALYGGRQFDELETYEIALVVTAIVGIGLSDMVLGQVDAASGLLSFIENNRPWASAAVVLAGYSGYWTLTFGGD